MFFICSNPFRAPIGALIKNIKKEESDEKSRKNNTGLPGNLLFRSKNGKDEECMVRLTRAIAAFKLDPAVNSKEYFTNRAIEESIRN